MPTVSSPMSATGYSYATNLNENGSIDVVNNASTTVKWTNSVVRGENLPGWRKLIRDGNDATTSLLGTKVTVRSQSGSTTVQKPKLGLPNAAYLTTVDGLHNLSLAPDSRDPSSIVSTKANNAALSKFITKLNEVNTAFNGGVFLGELDQTLRSIKNPAQGLRKLVGDWRQTAVRLRSTRTFHNVSTRRRQIQSALADSWLEAQFHWKPLLSDIDDGARALAEINTNQALKAARITAKSEVSANPIETYGSSGQGLAGWQVHTVTVEDVVVVYRGAVSVHARNSMLMRPELLGFNPASFVPTAWELVPYSFLIDYFTNVGDVLAGWAALTSNLSWCNRTLRKSYRRTVCTTTSLPFVKANYTPTATSCSSRPAQVITTKTSVDRAKFVGTFVPTFDFEIPGIGSKRWLNIAALIAGRESDRRFSLGD